VLQTKRPRPSRDIPAEILPLLVAAFPKAFFIWGTDPKPLKIGIYLDIRRQMPLIGARKLFMTLERYTKTRRYLESLIEGTERVDIDGNPSGIVEASHQDCAKALLAERTAAPKPQKKFAA